MNDVDHAVGDFLRARRDAAEPIDTLGRRRVTGLRREEVAALAGVSVSYYTRIEQGAVSATREILDAVAGALRLTTEEREYLRDLALVPHVGRDRGGPVRGVVDEGLARTLATLDAVPAAVLGFDMSLLAWNRRAHAVFAPHIDFGAPESASVPNWAVLLFTDAFCRALFTPWEPVALDMVGRLRASLAKHPDAPRLHAVIAGLRRTSSEFDELWRQHPVRLSPLGVVRLQHPSLGTLVLQDTVLRSNDASDQLLTLFHPVPSADAEGAVAGLD